MSTRLVHGEWATVHPALPPAKYLASVGSTIQHLVVEFHAALPHIVDVLILNGGNFCGFSVGVDLYQTSEGCEGVILVRQHTVQSSPCSLQ